MPTALRTLALGDHIEVTTPMTGRAPITWRGWVTTVTPDRAQVTDETGTGAMALLRNTPTARLLSPGHPDISTCPDCQTEVFGMQTLCESHAPAGL